MADFRELRKNLKKDYSAFPKLRIAVLADQASQYIAQALRAVSYEHRIDAEIYEGAFDRMFEEAVDEGSGLYAAKPDRVVVLPSAQNYMDRFYRECAGARSAFPEKEAGRICAILDALRERTDAPIILCNLCQTDDGLYGNFAGAYHESLLYTLRKTNGLLAEAVAKRSGVFLADIDMLQSAEGAKSADDSRMHYVVSCPWTMDFLAGVADRIFAVSDAIGGRVRKCLVTDLDGTLWGGVVGDVGAANIVLGGSGAGKAYADLQIWIRELSRRGIAVCVCSKNDEGAAMEPFLSHPDMVLKPEDVAVFVANWRDKAGNICEIREKLNIGFDSMVFIDDNPFEREQVRTALPDVAVPELPKDASAVPAFLRSLGLFETLGVSNEDASRTQMYRQEAQRERSREQATDIGSYLESLDMRCAIKPIGEFSIPRVAQLTQRTNQFNLRTVRYTESDIRKMSEDESCLTMAVSLSDRFGDYGIIGVAILKDMKVHGAQEKQNAQESRELPNSHDSLFLDTWLMSCRAVKRGVEEFFFNYIVSAAAERGYKTIVAEYIPTEKNAPVKNLLREMGFGEPTETQAAWHSATSAESAGPAADEKDNPSGMMALRLSDYKPKHTHINFNVKERQE